MIQLLRRLPTLARDDRALLCEATLLLVAARVGLEVLRYDKALWLTAVYARRFTHAPSGRAPQPQRLAWAVNAVATRLPFRTTCLVRALAGHAMLRRWNVPSELRVGVLPHKVDDRRRLQSHAWLESNGCVLIGDVENFDEYVVLLPSQY